MHAVRLEGENIGPWQGPFAFDFQLGAIGIFGKNGAGKSTLVDLMYASLTNEWTRVAPVKLDVVNNQAGKRTPAWVQFTFILDGVTCKVRRDVKPAGHELLVGADKAITNEKEITKRLSDLGIDGKMLAQCVFLQQNAIHEFLELPAGERARVYQALNHTGDCETINLVVGDMLNRDQDLCFGVEDTSDELGQRIQQLQQKKEDLEGQKSAQHGYLLSDKNRLAAEKMIAQANRYDALAAKKPKLETDLAKAHQDHQITSELEAKELDLSQTMSLAEDSVRPDYQHAVDALKQWTNHIYARQLKEAREKTVAELTQNLKAEGPPLEEDDDKVELYRSEVILQRRVLEDSQALLKTFGEQKKVKCPTCGTKVDSLKRTIEDAKGFVAHIPKVIAKSRQRIEAIDSRRQELHKFETWKEVTQTKLASAQKALDETPASVQPEGNKVQLQQTIDKFANALAEHDIVRQKLKRLTPEVAAKRATAATLQRQFDDMVTEMQQLHTDSDKLWTVMERLQQHKDATAVIANFDGQLIQIEEERLAKEDELDKLRARIARAAKTRAVVAILERVRDASHRNALPQRVAQINLNRMEGSINQGLELFGSPFWIETQENLDFLVHKPGEPGQKVLQTSIGQRVLLAIAFWSASHSLYRTKLGMLVLDEPSANLDADNRKYLAEAIARLTKRVRDKRQVIVISHAEELAGSFDQVINLDKKS